MILIGEKLNSSIPRTREAFEAKDEAAVLEMIRVQKEESEYLDVNTAMCAQEAQTMEWVIGLILAHCDCGIMIDTTDPQIMEQAALWCGDRSAVLNSLTLTQRYDEVIKIAKAHHFGVVALPIDDAGIPHEAQQRIANAQKLLQNLTADGIAQDQIFLDVLAESLAVNDQSGRVLLDTICGIRSFSQEVHLTCGLSNISFGLPGRNQINQALLVSAITCGMDSAICDTANIDFARFKYIAQLIMGQDEYCMEYIMKMKNS